MDSCCAQGESLLDASGKSAAVLAEEWAVVRDSMLGSKVSKSYHMNACCSVQNVATDGPIWNQCPIDDFPALQPVLLVCDAHG